MKIVEECSIRIVFGEDTSPRKIADVVGVVAAMLASAAIDQVDLSGVDPDDREDVKKVLDERGVALGGIIW